MPRSQTAPPPEIVWDWTRHPRQEEFIFDRSRFAVWQGGRGSTKTSSASFRLMSMIQNPQTGLLDPNWYGARGIVAAPINKQLKRGPLEKFDEIFGPTGMILKRVNGHDPRREMVNGWTVYGFNVGKDGEGAEAWRGSEYAWAWLDEAAQMPEKAFFQSNATLRQKRRDGTSYQYQTIITTTPRGDNWLNRRFLRPDHPYLRGKLLVIKSTTLESIRAGILDEDYAENIGYIPGTQMYRQEILGEVVGYEGLVFDFKEDVHVPDPWIPPKMTAVYGGIDIGTSDPTAIIVVGQDEAGAIWVLKEYYEKRARFDEWVDIAGQWDREFHVRKWFVDSDLTVKLCKQAGLRAYQPYKAKDAANVAINYLNQLMLRGMFFVNPACKALQMEMSSYEYKDELRGDEVTFLSKVKNGQPDHCLVAETVVLTDDGDRRIDCIRVGDRVLTRAGYKRVLSSRMTNPAAQVFDVQLSNEETVTGTANHPFWVEGQGWTRLDELRYGDTLRSWWMPSSSTASSSAAIPTPGRGRSAAITRRAAHIVSAVWGACTRKSGRPRTAPSLQAITFITGTAISSTTPSIIWNVSAQRSTARGTSTSGGRRDRTRNGWRIWTASGRSRGHGTPPMKAASGIASTAGLRGRSGFLSSEPVISAEANTKTSHDTPARVFALTPASPHGAAQQGWTTSTAPAPPAELPSASTGTAGNSAAPVRVERVTAVPGKHAVYNLQVEDQPEFFANGVLVHNSIDALRYAVLPLTAQKAQTRYGQTVNFSFGSRSAA